MIAKVVNAGVALLVYGRDDGVARTVCDVQTQWTGTGPAYMGNKGAVGVRFRVPGDEGAVGETFTCVLVIMLYYSILMWGSYLSFVCAHLTAYEGRLARRLADYKHIVGTLLFPPTSPESKVPTTIYSTSHLFFLGDLNFRLAIPPSHPLSSFHKRGDAAQVLSEESFRQQVKEFDELYLVQRKGDALVGLREGDFWKFKCSYKYQVGEVDKYR